MTKDFLNTLIILGMYVFAFYGFIRFMFDIGKFIVEISVKLG